MISELEQKFYDTFGIEPKNKCGKDLIYPNCLNPDKCGYDNCVYYQIEYPKITGEKLLEMICICNSTYINGYTNYFMSTEKAKEALKEEILKKCITLSEDIKAEIQQLFKEEG